MTTLRELVWEGSKFWSGWEDGRKGYMRLGVFRLFQKRHQEWQNRVTRQARMKKDVNIDKHDQLRALPQLSPQHSSRLLHSHWILPDCYYHSWRPNNRVVGWKTHCERKTMDEGQRPLPTLPVTQSISSKPAHPPEWRKPWGWRAYMKQRNREKWAKIFTCSIQTALQ